MLLQTVLQTARALGQPLLIAGQASGAVLCAVALTRFLELGGNLTLGVGKLPRLELQLAKRAALFVGAAGLHLPLQIAERVERPPGSVAGLGRILPAQAAGGAAHLFQRIAHPLAAAARCALLPALGLLTRLTLLPRLALLAALAVACVLLRLLA